jgi:NADPH2:quinone reductase
VRAVVSRESGPVESLVVEDLPEPQPGPGEVRVRVEAAALNFPDVLLVADGYQVPVPRPFTPGSELSGTVDALGEGVTGFAVGDLVVGRTMTGALAQQAVLPASSLTLLPAGTDLVGAAAVGVTGTTAYGALVQVARVRPGDTVLVLGAAGGVGIACIQVAVALGATVVAAASSEDKLAHCRAAGAQLTIDYGDGPAALRTALKTVRPGGVDVVLDPVGGAYAEMALRGCARGARFVTLGYASGEIPRIPLNLVLLKDVEVRGYDLRAENEVDPARAATVRADVFALFASGALTPIVSDVLALDEAAAGLRRIADRKAVGKLVVQPWR